MILIHKQELKHKIHTSL